ncbi:TlpA family protein disulfide reductase [Nocardia sp. NPDC057227]|uniref:TlpA family protein disulfide reductase n=1 Tax=Nocardia sp. NPDC057227 TaxID=3346056 RepID=UPI00362999D7
MTRWPVAARLALVAVIVAVAAVVALWPRSADSPAAGREAPAATGVPQAERAAAGLTPCPGAPASPTGGAGVSTPLAGLNLTCLADGKPVDLRAALAGKPALLNLWAYWCAPCAKELPHLQEFAGRAGDRMTVLTVHSDPEEAFALSRLTGLGVTLPGVLDPAAALRNAVGAPAVLPISVLLRADGTVADVVVRSFTDTDDVARTVAGELGVLV